MSIPTHQRANFERTDEALIHVQGLWCAFHIIDADYPNPTADDDVANARATLICLLDDRIRDLSRLHAMEWVGIGGNTNLLNEAEIGAARGKE